MLQILKSSTTVYSLKGKQICIKDLFQLPYSGFKKSVLRNVPLFMEKKKEIIEMIKELPESYNGESVCSNIRKEAYIRDIEMRIQFFFIPAYNKYIKG